MIRSLFWGSVSFLGGFPMLKDMKPQIFTITIDGKSMKLRYDMNALDYLERVVGSISEAFADQSMLGRKHMIRAALLCNYEENKKLLDEDNLRDLKPTLSQVGEWFDADTMKAVATELYTIALKQMNVEGENRMGEQQAVETLLTAIGALSKLYGRQNLEKAFQIFGTQPQAKL